MWKVWGASVTSSLVAATILLSSGHAYARPAQPGPTEPLPGCSSSEPNVGAVTRLSIRLDGDTLSLSWGAPKTRRGWTVDGYNVYRANPQTGVMALLMSVTSGTTAVLDFAQISPLAEGPVPLQVAAYASHNEEPDEEGCRTGRVMSGQVKVEEGQLVTRRSWGSALCEPMNHLNQIVFVVAGHLKANSKVVAPGAISLAIALSPARKAPGADEVLGWTFAQFVDAVKGWTREAVDPGYEFVVRSIRCFRR